MKIGLFTPLGNRVATPEYIRVLGQEAEALGFASLWLPEHVVLFDDYVSHYPYSSDGRLPSGGESGFLDPFGGLAFLAAVTQRIRLGTGICLVPQRNPLYTAKDVATVDCLSNGRFDFGVGVGWLAEEFQALGVPFAQRAPRTRAYLEVMRRLWCDPVSEYHDTFYDLAPCRQYPKPIQRPHPPIHFGGESGPALRRVADLGQGWYPFDIDAEQLAARLRDLDVLLAQRQRSRRDITVSVSPYLRPIDFDGVQRYRDIGVDQVILLLFATSVDEIRGKLETLAETMVEPAKRL